MNEIGLDPGGWERIWETRSGRSPCARGCLSRALKVYPGSARPREEARDVTPMDISVCLSCAVVAAAAPPNHWLKKLRGALPTGGPLEVGLKCFSWLAFEMGGGQAPGGRRWRSTLL